MMKLVVVASVLALLAPLALADCPNACSGHGDCQSNWDFCQCYNGWLGSDCSQRLCPFGLSFIDTPQGDLNHDNDLHDGFGDNTVAGASRPWATDDNTALNPMWRFQGWWERHPAALYGSNDQSTLPFYVHEQEGHFYSECSNRGLCNRENGLCECFTGYEGAACNRTSCINSCSGHGVCETMTEVTPDAFYYRLWDADKTQQCVCDGGYFGMDCSQRKCMTNDDPLTTKTSRVDYNDGLVEQEEIQYVDVRCPYNGMMLDPMVTLTYTDDQFGDEYETAQFDPTIVNTAGTDNVMALLKALPNQVLADFTVDGVTGVSKVFDVNAAALETNNFYRWMITFDSRMGDVPMLSGTPYFKCKGGAEVNWFAGSVSWVENVQVAFLGDGPSEFLEFDISTITDNNAADDTLEYVVKNKAGVTFNNLSPQSHTFTASGDALEFADSFTREATKVTFLWSLGTDNPGTNRGTSGGAVNIKIHVDPTITVSNQLYTLASSPTATQTIDCIDVTNGDITPSCQGTAAFTLPPTYDTKVELVTVDDANGHMAWYINDEFIAMATIGTIASVLETTSAAIGAVDTIPTNGASFTDTFLTAALTDLADHGFTWWLEKTPVLSRATGPDTIDVTFENYEPPMAAISLVLKIVTTSADPDTYTWKLAGDTEYVYTTLTGTTGHDVPTAGAPTKLGRVNTYVGTPYYPDDPLVPERAGVDVLLLDWTDDSDFDRRICESASSHSTGGKYYILVGSQGLNDAPECSDRGICDYGTGICKCFKGYAGIDCHLQNALSSGASTSA